MTEHVAIKTSKHRGATKKKSCKTLIHKFENTEDSITNGARTRGDTMLSLPDAHAPWEKENSY